MTTDTITIPPEAVKALELSLLGQPLSARNCTAAIRAVLTAWPGANVFPGMQHGMRESKPMIVLPLPTGDA